MTGTDSKLIETSPPFMVMLGLLWGVFWRSFAWFIVAMIGMVILMVPIMFLMSASLNPAALMDPKVALIANLVGFVIGIGVYYKALKGVIGKKFGGHRLVFLTPQAVEAAERAQQQAENLANAAAFAPAPIAPPPPPAAPPAV